MDSRQETIKKIKNLLRFHRNGLTITDIAQKLHLNRNSTAKYLEILLISGDVDLNTYGPAKVYTISRKMPISAILKFSADIIIMIDNEMRVLDANENALNILEISRENLVGHLIENVNSPLITCLAIPDVFEEIHKSGEVRREFALARQNEDHHYRVRLIPTIFDNREEGVTIIGEDITDQIRFEESLMISEARYRAIVQDQTDLICRWRPGGKLTFINETASRFIGISCADIQGENALSYIFPEDLPLSTENVPQLTPDQPTRSTELRVRNKEGEYRWIQWNTRGIFDNAGTLIERQSVGRDITDLKNAEDALRKSEQLYRTILDNIQDVYYRCDMDGTLVMASPSAISLLGYDSLPQMLGMNIAEKFYPSPEDRKKFLEILYRERKVSDHEITLKKRDGSLVIVSTNSQILHDPSGKAIGIEGFLRDITFRKEAEKALRESEEHYRSLAEQVHDGIYIYQGTRFVFVNTLISKITGYSKDELLTMDFIDLVHPDDRAYVRGIIGRRERGEQVPDVYEIRIVQKDGSVRYAELAIATIAYQGRYAVLGTARDVTDRKRVEEALKERLKELNCLYGISSLLELPGISLNEILKRIVMHIPPAWQFPEITGACIVLEGQTFETSRFRETPWMLTRDIIVNGNPIGKVEVCYLEERQESDEGPFMIEERYLLNAVAERLGRIIERKRAEVAVQESEERYRGVVEDQTELICRFTPDGILTFVNDAFCQYYRLDKKKCIGNSHNVELPPDDASLLKKHLASLTPGNPGDFIEHRILMTGGEIRWQRWNDHAFFNNDGQVTEYQSVGRDVTTIHQQSQRILESEERFHTITDLAPFPISIIDKTGNFRYLNKAFIQLFGYPQSDIPTNKDWLFAVFPDNSERNKAMLKWESDHANPRTGEVRYHIFTVTCKDGTIRQINISSVMLTGGDQYVVYEDLTPKNESDRLRSFLASIVNSSDDAIIGKTLDGTIISWNKAAERIYGYYPDEIIGKSITVLVPLRFRDQIPTFLEKIRAGESIEQFKATRIRKDGSSIDVVITLSPVRDEQGQIVGVSTIAKNLFNIC